MAESANDKPKPIITLRQVVTTVIVVAALAGFVWAFTLGDTSSQVRSSTSAVERFFPDDNSVIELRQTQIGLDLAPGWIATLTIDGTPIPDDQINCLTIEDCESRPPAGIDPQNVFFFVPAQGKVIEEMAPGRHCALAALTPVAGSDPGNTAKSVEWCFNVA